MRPATWALLQADEGDHFDAVLEALAGAEPPKAAGVTCARMRPQPPSDDRRSTPPFWTHGAPPLRAVILDVIARQNLAWASTKVPEALRAKDPMLLAVALGLAVRRLPDPRSGRSPGTSMRVSSLPTRACGERRWRRGFILGSKRLERAARDAIASGA